MINTALLVFCVAAFIIFVFGLICKLCFDDSDPDMYWLDNYASDACPHPKKNRSDVVVASNATCETINTICDDCSAILNTRTEC